MQCPSGYKVDYPNHVRNKFSHDLLEAGKGFIKEFNSGTKEDIYCSAWTKIKDKNGKEHIISNLSIKKWKQIFYKRKIQ